MSTASTGTAEWWVQTRSGGRPAKPKTTRAEQVEPYDYPFTHVKL
jgi:hypothetical protein